ncbi:MAG: TfoX/Sxy family protein [Ruminococcus sp.]
MATSKEYLNYILEQLSGLDEITYQAMMGEYIIYYKGRIAGGICDNRFLVKPVKAAVALLPDAPLEKPYDGAKEMLLIENIDDREFLAKLFNTMYDELPVPKKKSKKK